LDAEPPPPEVPPPPVAPAAPTPPSAVSPAAPPASPPTKSRAPDVEPATETKTVEDDADPTESMLNRAGYPLTPGVSALPLRDEFVFSGYLQGQYESHQNSEDQLQQGGTLLNQDRFLLRRGRFRITRDWEWAEVIVEIDGNTTRGPAVRFQKAEASLIYGRSKDKDQPPLAQLTIGQFDTPFGFEVPFSPKYRVFMERTQASRALFPGEPDVGVRFSGGYSFARYSVALTNGEPLDEKTAFALQDPNANKDITARFGAESKASRDFVIAGGISYNRGKGLSAGADATKNTINWVDGNGNAQVEPSNELTGEQGKAATVSKNFDRWAIGADLELLLHTGLGWSMLYGEVVAASNLDRGLLISDPIATGFDLRQLGYYVAFTQEITPYGLVGFRYDFYDPNSDVTDSRRGKVLPASAQVKTFSPMVGLALPGRARLVFQYDVIRDLFARDTRGVPTDFKNDQWTLRLQLNL
jgi:hypothetical protein